MTNPSKVEKLIIKNIKNIEYVEMIAGDKVNYIAGNNGAGKTSVIEAIFQAIDLKRYVESGNARKLIKKGEDKGEITLTISHKGDEIDIVRTFDKEKGVKMTAKSKNGYKLDQTFLNTLLGDFTIDPLAFSRMKASDQINTLKSIAGINTDDIDANIDRLFDDRTHKSRLERELRAIVDKHSDVEEIAKTKSVSELSSKRDDMTNHNYRINYLRRGISEETQKITDYTNQIKQLQEKIAQSQQYIDDNQEESNQELHDMTQIDKEIAEIDEHNAKAYRREQYQNKVREHAVAKSESEGLDQEIEELRQQKRDMYIAAGLPIEGLSFDDEGLMVINGVPFEQLSTAEKIQISTILATHDKPELKVLYIQDGSLLDDATMEIISNIATDNDYQIFVELVGEDQSRETTLTLRQGRSIK